MKEIAPQHRDYEAFLMADLRIIIVVAVLVFLGTFSILGGWSLEHKNLLEPLSISYSAAFFASIVVLLKIREVTMFLAFAHALALGFLGFGVSTLLVASSIHDFYALAAAMMGVFFVTASLFLLVVLTIMLEVFRRRHRLKVKIYWRILKRSVVLMVLLSLPLIL